MRHISQTIAIAMIGALLLITAGCGDHHKVPGQGALPAESKTTTLQDALSQLDALQKPDGVDSAVWHDLKAALKSALSTNYELPTTKIVSTPPTGTANKVDDLTATRETNGDFTLSWHYRNIGDYDQNGTVSVSDLSSLAMHFGETYDTTTEANSIQAVIDGSGNGKIGVEDITQIAQYFGCELAQYSMQGGDQQQGPFAQATTEQLPAEGRGDARLAFAFNLGDQPAYSYWRVAPLDGDNNPGDGSNVVVLNVEAPVRVLGVTPLNGTAGAEVTFTAFVTGTGPFTYEWDFGDGATPNTSTDAQPVVTLSATEAAFPAHVKVAGATGSVTYPFTLTVTPIPGNPPVINSVGPLAGLSGDELAASADVSGDEPLTYSWEFDGGASPPVSSEVSPTVILSRGGTLPAPDVSYPCRLTVTNDFGVSSIEFTITVSSQWHVEDLPFAPYTNKGTVRSLCFSSDGVLCGVSSYYVTESGQTVVALERYIDGQWVIEPVTTGNYTPSFEGWNLCFTSYGSPIVAWGDHNDNAVHIARKLGDSWQHEVISLGGGFWPITKLMLDSQNQVVIAYAYFTGNGNESAFKIARQTGASWDIFDYPIASPLSQVVINSDGMVLVTNNADDSRQAMLYRETGDEWSKSLVYEASEEATATPREIIIDASGLVHIIIGGVNGRFLAWETSPRVFQVETLEPSPSGAMDLMLVPEVGDVVLFSAISDPAPAILTWKYLGSWQTVNSVITGTSSFVHLLVHPSGYPVIESGIQMAAYW